MKLFFSLALLCVDSECEEGASFYILRMVSLLRYFRKHRMQPPPRALIAPLEQGWVERSWVWCAYTMGVAAPWASPLTTTLLRWVAGWAWMAPTLVFWPKFEVWMGFDCVLLECAFSIAHFGAFSHIALQNMYIPKLVENVSYKAIF